MVSLGRRDRGDAIIARGPRIGGEAIKQRHSVVDEREIVLDPLEFAMQLVALGEQPGVMTVKVGSLGLRGA